jgi:hypothetical protein
LLAFPILSTPGHSPDKVSTPVEKGGGQGIDRIDSICWTEKIHVLMTENDD